MILRILHPERKINAPRFLTDVRSIDPEQTFTVKKIGHVTLRSIRPDDEERMIRFHKALSEESIYMRYFEHISLDTRTLHERLAKVCTNTADSHAIVAEYRETSQVPEEIVAVGRLITTDVPGVAAFALLMADKVQETDLGHRMFERLIAIARAHGFHTLNEEVLVADHDTLNLCRSFGFALHTVPEDGIVQVSYNL